MYNNFFSQYGFSLSGKQVNQFKSYFEILVSENQKYNLTAITDEKDVYIKHFLDSILIKSFFDTYAYNYNGISIMDIGTGGGFPAIPIKIIYPEINVSALDALNKRINFLNIVSQQLKLDGIEFFHGRAEDYGQDSKFRETYDIAVSRAVAELRMLLEYVMPFVKINGYFVAYKSLKFDEELHQAQNALRLMKTEYLGSIKVNLPEDYGTRELMIFKKMGKIANKYPRKAGTAKKTPL